MCTNSVYKCPENAHVRGPFFKTNPTLINQEPVQFLSVQEVHLMRPEIDVFLNLLSIFTLMQSRIPAVYFSLDVT